MGGGIDQKNIYDSPDPPPGGHPTPFHSEQVLGHSALCLFTRCRCERKCEFSMNEVVFKSNTSLAVPGALAYRLQHCTTSKIKNGCQAQAIGVLQTTFVKLFF